MLLTASALLALAPFFSGDNELFKPLDFDQALAAAKQEQKLVFVDFFTTWCGPCKKLDKTTWLDEGVVEWLNARTVSIKLDAEVATEVAKRYAVSGYPTLLFVDASGKERGRMVGYLDAESFLATAPLRLAGKTEVDELQAKLAGNQDDVGLRFEYGKALARAGRSQEALAELLFAFDNGRKTPSFAGVRISFLLSEIGRLGKTYPAALDALRERAQTAAKALAAGSGGRDEAVDFAALNKRLGEPHKTLELYDTLRASEKPSRVALETLFDHVIDQLLALGRYQEVLDGAGDIDARIQQRIELLEQASKLSDNDQLRQVIRGNVVNRGARFVEAYLGAKRPDQARRLAERLLDFHPVAKSFALLATKAAALEDYELTRDILKRGFELLADDEQSALTEINGGLPPAERYDDE